MNILDALKEDYRRFPKDQTYDLYAADVYFKDPMNEFRGRDRYQAMIGFIDTWFQDIQFDLHDIERIGSLIRTTWTLRWTTPLPWKPRIQIRGWSDLRVDRNDVVISHIDYWNCSRLDVLKQHLPWVKANQLTP